MVALACDLQLDKLIGVSDNHKWSWFRRYCHAARVSKSLIHRSPLPQNFFTEVRKKLVDDVQDNMEGIWDHENHKLFRREHDEQLLAWLNRKPEDWTLSWGGSGTIYGWGHNHRGQLGGIEGAKVKIPTSCDALSSLRPIQILGGEQTLIGVTADGKVYATGKRKSLHFDKKYDNFLRLWSWWKTRNWRNGFRISTNSTRVNTTRLYQKSWR